LLAVNSLVQNGNTVIFTSEDMRVVDSEGNVVATATAQDGLWYLDERNFKPTPRSNFVVAYKTSAVTMHRRLVHKSPRAIRQLAKLEIIKLSSTKVPDSCITCIHGKSHRHPLSPSLTRASHKFEKLHMD
ncbi:hypothetical protein T439DRAFT_276753, partial [Meredithblackwellia eburnea MCA 4105]